MKSLESISSLGTKLDNHDLQTIQGGKKKKSSRSGWFTFLTGIGNIAEAVSPGRP
ncbi:hypothetical protein [Lactiplantibacillus songbeiensis]|uniref:Uncharacterized protein n=1 Tax=Lactiplantibacillus songbeiensis TaxID=2559920 RepID=A0ABW4BXD6_9LACO|nr:hypothetical protein [Lactiplantibacillus songbeiensis]